MKTRNHFRIVLFLFFIVFFHLQRLQADDVTSQNLSEQEKNLIHHIKESIQKAEMGQSKLHPAILNIHGMSSPKIRHLLNNLCSLNGTSYLEIGTWKGSTWISALYHNDQSIVDAVAIDNWSEFNGPKDEFLRNCRKFLPNSKYRFFSVDSFSLDKSSAFTQPINIYFYDGDHSVEAHESALTYYNDVLNNLFILIVDDWNWASVRQGTHQALNKLNYNVLYSEQLPSRFINDAETWWNGIYIALIAKAK